MAVFPTRLAGYVGAMPIRPLRTLVLVLFAAALVCANAAQAQNSPAAQKVLNRARAASGGAGWNGLRGLHETGQEGENRYERWTDVVRYGDRTDVKTPKGLVVQGYNGAYEWRIVVSGKVTGTVDPNVTRRVRTEAFFAAYAYFFPSRFDLRSSYLGERAGRGRAFDVLSVQPAGGAPRELWFDRATGLLGMLIDDSGPRRTTTEFSDYRRVGPVMIPFLSVTTGGALPAPRERRVEKVDFPVADRGLFTLSPERVKQGW